MDADVYRLFERVEKPQRGMNEDANVIRGRDAQRMIIATAWEMAEAVRPTLGPLGMDNMLVDRMGNRVLTNDGATIVKSIETRDPVAQIIAEVAKSQEQSSFDGTTTCIILIGELLKKAGEMVEKGIHPNSIIKGYRIGLSQAIEAARESAESMQPIEAAKAVASTAMTGKSAEDFGEILADICARAASIAKPSETKILTIPGSPADSELIEGLVIIKAPTASGMPEETKGKVMLLEPELNAPVAQVSLADPKAVQQMATIQSEFIKHRVEEIVEMGVKILFCQKGIDSRAAQLLRKNGILAFRNIRRSDMYRLSQTTGAAVMSDIGEFNIEDLGEGEAEVKQSVNTYVAVRGTNLKAATIIIPAPTEQSAEEFQRALDDAVGVASLCIEEPWVVAGAGCVQSRMCSAILASEQNPNPKVETARIAFGEALMVIPMTLAESAGMDLMEVAMKMKADPNLGVNVEEGVLSEMSVKEPLAVVKSAMSSAVENGVSLLRTHSIYMSKPIQELFAQAERDA